MSTVQFVFVQECCVICHKSLFSDTVEHTKATPTGLSTLIRCSIMRGDEQLEQYLKSEPTVAYIHVICRKSYTDTRLHTRKVGNDQSGQPERSIRSNEESFNWKEDCFLCGKRAAVDNAIFGDMA